MAASDHLQPQQLSMFMTARELYNHPSVDVAGGTSDYGGHWKSLRSMHMTKRRENKADGLDVHVAEHGVHGPVTMAHTRSGPRTSDGHHRIVAAYDANPESLVPVEHEGWDGDRPFYLARHREAIADDHAARQKAPGWTPKERFPSYP